MGKVFAWKARVAEPEARFWESIVRDPDTECWEWTGWLNDKGYGSLWAPTQAKILLAHRVAYELVIGPIPKGLQIDHLCRNRACANPDHLEPVTRQENILRGVSPAGVNVRKTHCKRGHEFTAENTRHYDGKRLCLECRRAAARARNIARRRAA